MCRQCPGGPTRVDMQLHKPGEAASVLQQAQHTASGPGQPAQAGAPPGGLQLPGRGPAQTSCLDLHYCWTGPLQASLSVLKLCVWMRSSLKRRSMHMSAPTLGSHVFSNRSTSEQAPEDLSGGQYLAWVSLAGNPCCASPPPHRREIKEVSVAALGMGASLGGGASGDVFAATMACPPI